MYQTSNELRGPNMRFIALFTVVTAIAIVQQYVAAPLGLSWDLGRHNVALASFLGGMIGVVAFVLAGPTLLDTVTNVFRRLFRRPPKEPDDPADDEEPSWFDRTVDRWGAPFLGIAGPLTIGGWGAAILGSAKGIGKMKLIVWLAVGQAFVTASYVYSIAELTD